MAPTSRIAHATACAALLVIPANGLAAVPAWARTAATGPIVTTASHHAAQRAARWLATQPMAQMPAGQQADVVVDLRITGASTASLAPRLRSLSRVAPAYATTAGAAAKVVMAVSAAGANPTALGGVDYLGRMRSAERDGRFGTTAFDQALSMIALRMAGRRVPPASVGVLLKARSGSGWNFSLDPTQPAGVDDTALSVVALRAGGLACSTPAIRAARAWLARHRSGAGWTAFEGQAASANSTALVARAEIACGGRPLAALAFIRSLQASSGSVAFTRAAPESRMLATSESVPALAGVSMANGLSPG